MTKDEKTKKLEAKAEKKAAKIQAKAEAKAAKLEAKQLKLNKKLEAKALKEAEKITKTAEKQAMGRRPKKILSPKEQEAKDFKKSFSRQANYFKALKKIGNMASKDFKVAKKELKKGNKAKAQAVIAKYTVMDINAWAKILEK